MTMQEHTYGVRIAYLYNRPVTEAEAMDCEDVYADFPGTNRADLTDLLEYGVAEGDVVVVRALSDLGSGAAARRHQKRIESLGAEFQILPTTGPRMAPGRRSKVQFVSMEAWQAAADVWYSAAPLDYALKSIGRKVNGKVNRNWCNFQFGPRDRSKHTEKREAMLKRLGQT